jgi:hypothetical protein
MPLSTPEDHGTEKNGAASQEYCRYCYQGGAFLFPDMKIEEMTEIVKQQMSKRNIPANIIDTAVNILPHLKRWKKLA